MKRKLHLILLIAVFLSSSLAIAQETKVKVIVERAHIYAESSTASYRVETVKRGTILTLFGTKQADKDWFYVYYQSPRWGSKVTGFIQAEMVEKFSEGSVPEETREEIPKVSPPVQKSEPERRRIVEKEGPLRAEREVGITVSPSHRVWPFPLSYFLGQKPHVYEVEEPHQPKNAAREEELEVGTLPEGANRPVQKKDQMDSEVWKEEVVIPDKTEVMEKERHIEEAAPTEKKEKGPEKEPQIITQEPPKIAPSRSSKRGTLFTVGLGYGPSLGGIGGFLQLNTAGNFAVHWGVGYYPTSMFYPDFDWVEGKVLFSVGVKYYIPLRSEQVRPYLDLQYGGISVEAVRIVTGIWYYTYVYEDIQKTLWGPSLLAGIELRFGSFGLNGSVGASYVVTKWEYWDQPVFVTADIGFLLYF